MNKKGISFATITTFAIIGTIFSVVSGSLNIVNFLYSYYTTGEVFLSVVQGRTVEVPSCTMICGAERNFGNYNFETEMCEYPEFDPLGCLWDRYTHFQWVGE